MPPKEPDYPTFPVNLPDNPDGVKFKTFKTELAKVKVARLNPDHTLNPDMDGWTPEPDELVFADVTKGGILTYPRIIDYKQAVAMAELDVLFDKAMPQIAEAAYGVYNRLAPAFGVEQKAFGEVDFSILMKRRMTREELIKYLMRKGKLHVWMPERS